MSFAQGLRSRRGRKKGRLVVFYPGSQDAGKVVIVSRTTQQKTARKRNSTFPKSDKRNETKKGFDKDTSGIFRFFDRWM